MNMLLYKLFSLNRYEALKTMYKKIYTTWISNAFRSIGDKTLIAPFSLLHGASYITIGNNVVIGRDCTLTAWDRYRYINPVTNEVSCQHFTPSIEIRDNVEIGIQCHLSAINKISLGNGVLMGKWVSIVDNNHGLYSDDEKFVSFDENGNKSKFSVSVERQCQQYPSKRPLYSKGPIIIQDSVWIGDKVTILANVTVGRGSVIAANSVVTKDVPEYSIVAGNPAKLIKKIKSAL